MDVVEEPAASERRRGANAVVVVRTSLAFLRGLVAAASVLVLRWRIILV